MVKITTSEFSKLKALHRLSREGVGGERDNALAAFDKLLSQYKISKESFFRKIGFQEPEKVLEPKKEENIWEYTHGTWQQKYGSSSSDDIDDLYYDYMFGYSQMSQELLERIIASMYHEKM